MVVIIVHGGAGNCSPDLYKSKLNGVILAAKKGYEQLKNNRSSLDAVVAAAVSLEDDPSFNAGTGSSLTVDATVENDAFCMEGKEMQIGAVASVKKFKNPIKVARLVMEKSEHCILSGEGAHQFAELNGIKLIDNQELVHQNALNRLAKCKTFDETIETAMKNDEPPHHFENQIRNERNKILKIGDHDTVGACALDHLGNLACSTTTGGLTSKAVGRIGDSPLSGSGGWAQNDVCAISTTGHGEKIMRVGLAKHIALELERLHEQNESNNEHSNKEIINRGVNAGLKFMRDRVDGFGGVICVDKNGEFSAQFTTKIMPWCAIDGKKIYYGISSGQIEEEELTDLD